MARSWLITLKFEASRVGPGVGNGTIRHPGDDERIAASGQWNV